MSEQRKDYTLDALLAASRAEYQAQAPPEQIERRLEAMLAGRRRQARQRLLAGALAACGVCAALLWGWAREHRRELRPQTAQREAGQLADNKRSQAPGAAQRPEHAAEDAISPRRTQVPARKRATQASGHRSSAGRSPAGKLPADEAPAMDGSASEAAARRQFLAIPYTPPFDDTDPIDIYRVEIPRATAAGYGVPLPARAGSSVVTADLAVGGDGVARAIRFVQ